MSAPSPKAVDGGLVSFNGLRVKKTTVTNLVDSLVKSDPLKAPTGENLSDNRRRDIGLCPLTRPPAPPRPARRITTRVEE